MKRTECRTCSSNPFLLDLWMAVLAQFGQKEDLSKIAMAYFSRHWLGLLVYTQIDQEFPHEIPANVS